MSVPERDTKTTSPGKSGPTGPAASTKLDEHIVEIISDSGEGAQTAGQMFGTVSAKKGNSVWTVEIIPAEIEPPARSTAGASGIRTPARRIAPAVRMAQRMALSTGCRTASKRPISARSSPCASHATNASAAAGNRTPRQGARRAPRTLIGTPFGAGPE